MKTLKHLEVILKTVERCNLNCTYCYFFHGEDHSYKKHPPFIKLDTIQKLTQFLVDGVKEFKLQKIQIDLHGGEPTLQKKEAFDEMCSHFRSHLDPITELTIALQTNATLIDEEWIDLFSKHNIFIGLSIDGPKEINDKFRVDYSGNGSYDRVIKGLKKLQQSATDNKIQPIAALCVINPNHSAKKLYHHIVHELKIDNLDFLLPDYTHETFVNENPDNYGKFLSDLFQTWIEDDNPQIQVRILNSALSLLTGGKTQLKGFGPGSNDIEAITVSSNGDLSPDDSLRSGIPHLMNKSNIFTSSLKQFFESREMKEVVEAETNTPDKCKFCCWEKVCGGNALISRYNSEKGFNNPSVFCSGLKSFYTAVTRYILENGISREKLKETLITKSL